MTLDPQILTTPLGVLVFNQDGDMLLTGGMRITAAIGFGDSLVFLSDDSGTVNIWNVDTGRHFQAVRMEAYGASTSAIWLNSRVFAVGCQNGLISIYQQEQRDVRVFLAV